MECQRMVSSLKTCTVSTCYNNVNHTLSAAKDKAAEAAEDSDDSDRSNDDCDDCYYEKKNEAHEIGEGQGE